MNPDADLFQKRTRHTIRLLARAVLDLEDYADGLTGTVSAPYLRLQVAAIRAAIVRLEHELLGVSNG